MQLGCVRGWLVWQPGLDAPRLLTVESSPVLVNLIATLLLSFSIFCFGAAVWREVYAKPAFKFVREPRLPIWLLISVSTALALTALAAAFIKWL